MLSFTYKTKHFLFQTAKLLWVIVCFNFLYEKITESKAFVGFDLQSFFYQRDFPFGLLLLIALFSAANWGIEFIKWKDIITTVTTISYKKASSQSLIAFALGTFTPNKIGEYGIRPMFFTKTLRKKVALLTGIHHFTQLLVTVLFGSIGFLILLARFPQLQQYTFAIIAILFLPAFIFIFCYTGEKKSWFSIPYFTRTLEFLAYVKKKAHFKSFVFSMLRYLIFSHQFIFLLAVFGSPLTYIDTFTAITVIYLLSTLLPAISFFDIVVKGSAAVFVFAFFGIEERIIIQVIAVMWTFNYLIPMLAGSILILQTKYANLSGVWKVS
ncbi:hypothetical protein ACJD0Z_02555 [Flavobacteriaceae bacterium M23B6Z8]